jgi:integrase/recombinase XerD
MIEAILEEPLALARHRTAPLLRERQQFLAHLVRQGTSHLRGRSIAAYLIHIIRLMKLTSLRNAELDEVKTELENSRYSVNFIDELLLGLYFDGLAPY